MKGLKLAMLFKGQIVWIILFLTLIGLFAYGEITATRLFNDKATENWQPSGASSHSSHSNIHHK